MGVFAIALVFLSAISAVVLDVGYAGEICPTATDGHAACPIGKYDPDGLKVISLVG